MPPVSSHSLDLRSAKSLFVAGITGEPLQLVADLQSSAAIARGMEVTMVQIPGLPSGCYETVLPDCRMHAYFMTERVRRLLVKDRAKLYLLDYLYIRRQLASRTFDHVVGQFCLPDEQGWCYPALTCDFLPQVWRSAARRIAYLNVHAPRVQSTFKVHVSEFDVCIESGAPLQEMGMAALSEAAQAIAAQVAGLVQDGDTLQIGIGSIADAVGQSLRSHRQLSIHSGMISPFILPMLDKGCLNMDAPLVTGALIGNQGFYTAMAQLPNLVLSDVGVTHSVPAILQRNTFVAINFAMEVDLFGQVNSEMINDKCVSGPGGLPIYAMASHLHEAGRLIVCLPASTPNGRVSRIVPKLSASGITSVAKGMVDYVVTEFGCRQIKGKSTEAVAQALIEIAHPGHRDALQAAWDALRVKM